MTAEDTKATETAAESAPAATTEEAGTSNDASKSLPSTPTAEKAAALFSNLKRNLTTKLNTTKGESSENKEENADASGGDQNLSTPTPTSAKRLSARATEFFSDIRGAFKQPLVTEDADKNKEGETPAPAAAAAAATTEGGAEGEAKPNRRLTLRVQDLMRGAWSKPLVDKKDETAEAANNQEAAGTGSWLSIFGGAKTAEPEPAPEATKPNKESFFAVFHNLVKKEEEAKKDDEATDDAGAKLKSFFKRRKSTQAETSADGSAKAEAGTSEAAK
ncbi:uncharacterized protein FA14DRAFT_177413 [Meira miltonrushii]|uniref:Uncharacterized protein n=1 Tax=Meira miltonrushii TaxID=1280837 RepID=A0A316VRL3_9BASI|nr:uncharacterized protein FA14DRAFT_177413 [Meira miltonrushii]PWN38135.1 hypothetical protein FA14DRAFT_177413 [Meira miltonrushii]